MTASYQDDEDLLGIDDFFQKLSTSCESRKNAPVIQIIEVATVKKSSGWK